VKLSFLALRWISLPIKIFSLLLFAGWWKHFHQRCGLLEPLPDVSGTVMRIWIHVPSIGEVDAVDALLKRLIPNESISIAITTEHHASYSVLAEKYSSSVALVTLVPFDFPFFIKRTWGVIKPDWIISVHQAALFELWHYASIKKVPVTLINSSLSTLEFRILAALPIFTRHLVAPFERIYVRSSRDRERFFRLGVSRDKLIVAGNLKSDMQPYPSLAQDERYELLREAGFIDREPQDQEPLVLMGISTWSGEERFLLHVMKDLREQGVDVRLILAPRFPERRMLLKFALRFSKYSVAVHSQRNRAKFGLDTACRATLPSRMTKTTDVYFLDVTGELVKFLQMADVGFVGNSLPPHRKGQNPFEAAAVGLPIVVGPNSEDFHSDYESLLESGGGLKGEDLMSTRDAIIQLIKKRNVREQIGFEAREWLEKKSADSEVIIRNIEETLSTRVL
tara:strand:- start:2896 stop:4248 length:1353 start_codon:yes stop_codon:yes gene_type:complete